MDRLLWHSGYALLTLPQLVTRAAPSELRLKTNKVAGRIIAATTPLTMPRPAAAHLHLSVPPPSEALFQHSPSPNSSLKREWEPGCQPDVVYDRALPPWRARLRRMIVKRLREERDWMAGWQRRVRTEGRDRYFYWTALFGTHTFFMTFLPLLFWFGYPSKGRGLLNAVGLGIYMSSFCKDLVCTPRPYSPPVVRLSMSTHAHEYGFPSSHSTNSVTIALFFAHFVWENRDGTTVGVILEWTAYVVLAVYAVSVVGGRLYTGMHSTADIYAGSVMGVVCWIAALVAQPYLEDWILYGSRTLPLITIPLTLACVHYHPSPVDPCPCFEDAIAVLAVMLGAILGAWEERISGRGVPSASTFGIWSQGVLVGTVISLERVVLGISIIVIWRLIAKATLIRTLPFIFRAAASVFDFELPTRAGYQPATSYPGIPPTPLRAVPSFLDLPSTNSPDGTPDVSPDGSLQPGSVSSSRSPSPSPVDNDLRRRLSVQTIEAKRKESTDRGRIETEGRRKPRRRRTEEEIKYDVEVLTKVVVYAGIGLLATTYSAIIFGIIERRIIQLMVD